MKNKKALNWLSMDETASSTDCKDNIFALLRGAGGKSDSVMCIR